MLPHFGYDEILYIEEVRGQRLLVRPWTWRDGLGKWWREHGGPGWHREHV